MTFVTSALALSKLITEMHCICYWRPLLITTSPPPL